MYKNSKIKRVTPASSIPKPVYVSQKRIEPKNDEKENEEIIPPDEVPSSQNYEVPSSQNPEQPNPVLTQPRFLSQRHQIKVATQDRIRGKNYFEIALITCKIKFSEFGKLIS